MSVGVENVDLGMYLEAFLAVDDDAVLYGYVLKGGDGAAGLLCDVDLDAAAGAFDVEVFLAGCVGSVGFICGGE